MAAILTGVADSVRAMDLAQLRRDGYTVVEGVAGPEQIEPLLALAQAASGVVLDDPSTWDPDAGELLELWDDQAQWDLRQHPPLYEAFAAPTASATWASAATGSASRCPGGAACASTTTSTRTRRRRCWAGSST
jgi:hypothetical protein